MIAALVYSWRWGMPGFFVVGVIGLACTVLLPLSLNGLNVEICNSWRQTDINQV